MSYSPKTKDTPRLAEAQGASVPSISMPLLRGPVQLRAVSVAPIMHSGTVSGREPYMVGPGDVSEGWIPILGELHISYHITVTIYKHVQTTMYVQAWWQLAVGAICPYFRIIYSSLKRSEVNKNGFKRSKLTVNFLSKPDNCIQQNFHNLWFRHDIASASDEEA